jgi:hypothetical protein
MIYIDADQEKEIRITLQSLQKEKGAIDGFIDRLRRHFAIAEASAPANIVRNEPIKYGGSTLDQVEKIIKATAKIKQALSILEKNKELVRLGPHDHAGDIERLYQAAIDAKKYQSATGENAPEEIQAHHLRPEYKGKNVTSHYEIEALVLLQGALEEFFPEIQVSHTASSPYFALAAILLKQIAPTKTIKRMMQVLS